MQVFENVPSMQAWLEQQRLQNRSIGLVPTMGALHAGHLSLVRNARNQNDIVVASIFVNPTQFNDPGDLENYPRQEAQDLAMLKGEGCDAVLMPSVAEMYPNGTEHNAYNYAFGPMETVMEGAGRPGHFEGVARIVSRLFDIVAPNSAYFGDKDFQQLSIVRAVNAQGNYGIRIEGCPIVREEDGLAMSSRNQLLTAEHRAAAPFLYRCLLQANRWSGSLSIDEVRHLLAAMFEENELFALEYFDFVDPVTLQPVANWEDVPKVQACVAAFIGNVRLLDNMTMQST